MLKKEDLAEITKRPTDKIVLTAGSIRLVNWTRDSLVEHAFRHVPGDRHEDVVVTSIWRGDFGTMIISAKGTLRFVLRGIWLDRIVIDTCPARIAVYDDFRLRMTGRGIDPYAPLTITRPWIKTQEPEHVDDYGFAKYIGEYLMEEDMRALTA